MDPNPAVNIAGFMEESNEPNYEVLLSTLDDNQKQELETHKQRNETLLKENEERKKRRTS